VGDAVKIHLSCLLVPRGCRLNVLEFTDASAIGRTAGGIRLLWQAFTWSTTASSEFIVVWPVIVRVVCGDSVAADIVWWAITVTSAGASAFLRCVSKPVSMFARTLPGNRNCYL
jgi:hypothetical protein